MAGGWTTAAPIYSVRRLPVASRTIPETSRSAVVWTSAILPLTSSLYQAIPPEYCALPPEPGVQLSNPFPSSATTILVVDDERLSRRLASRILGEQGYRLFEADGAIEAMQVLSKAKGAVDLIILDVVMPGCNGVELGRRVLEQWPDQRILYMSAHPTEVVRHGLPEARRSLSRQALHPR